MISFRLALLPLAFAATPVLAETTQPAAKSEVATADKKVCRSVATTGSNMRKRMCMTRAEWAQIDGTNGENAERAMDSKRAGGMNNGL